MEAKELFTTKGKIIIGLILVVSLIRLFPHLPNFTPIGAMALFGGTYISNKRWAILLPLIALFISDMALQIFNGTGFHATMPFVYGSLVLISMLGFLLRKRVQRQTIMVSSLVGSLIFFFVTNFGTWLTEGIYGHSLSGLTNCYIMGIPFFKGTVMGDLFYNLILFGSYGLVKWKFPKLAV
ncbi:MAG TPA: DUF6580 family putative transport protein [Bacteroidia bacterium]|nr:DUF6580 family putative transport protein [Bacteroidia bacterium]